MFVLMYVYMSICICISELSGRKKVAHAYKNKQQLCLICLPVCDCAVRSFGHSFSLSLPLSQRGDVGANSAFVLLHAFQYYSIRLRFKLIFTDCRLRARIHTQTRYIHTHMYACMYVYYIF